MNAPSRIRTTANNYAISMAEYGRAGKDAMKLHCLKCPQPAAPNDLYCAPCRAEITRATDPVISTGENKAIQGTGCHSHGA